MATKQNGVKPAARKTRRPATPVEPVEEAPAGFQRKPKLITMEFIGEWEGMRVSVRAMPYGDMLDGGLTLDWDSPEVPRDEWWAGLRATSDAFVSVLHSWNLLDKDGHPVPATGEGLRSLDQDQAITVVVSWAVRVIGVSAPLGKPSGSGGTSPEPSIPMETLSPNQSS